MLCGSPARVGRRLRLEPRELRFLEEALDGHGPAGRLGGITGVSRLASLQLLALLDLYGALIWHPAPSPADLLERRAIRWELADPFEVLGVDGAADDAQLERAYRERQRAYAAGGPHDAVSPDACAAIRDRIEAAYAILRDPERRAGLAPSVGRSSEPRADRRSEP